MAKKLQINKLIVKNEDFSEENFTLFEKALILSLQEIQKELKGIRIKLK